ncbi:DUF362 domain-containing protein [Pectinatus brassicae]|uniref:4Fe-4S ferredoxin-type domain-containing protein n=1 Tax=Pectinatus brassicae TaxID=862415 RepID=A0A840UR24_9FIRM|nr:DUF362 domain-containing protein [Pectinatus brassicae]MBB5336612.1 hypothetical protein [Pectinatus brassicae]
MTKSKVYFTDMRVHPGKANLLQKLDKLIKKAGIENIDFNDKFAALKIHFGEYGNLSFLRPNYAKVVADAVKEAGGKPFLTDCNTLYVGSRKEALEHLDTANLNGFGPMTTGCQNIIADGLKGTDEVEVPVVNGEYVKNAKIGRALMDADIIITLTHFKGHEMTGFGGAIKNIGMGGGSRAGKMEMHCEGKPSVKEDKCIGCGMCAKTCAHGAPIIADRKCHIDEEKCVGCGRCIGVCPTNAIIPTNWNAGKMVNLKMAEYAQAVLHGRPHFHISLIVDVSPNCDCHSENDAAIVPNIGMLASFDPVAIDQACADLVNKAPVISNSALGENLQANPGDEHKHDHFHNNHPDTEWESCLDHCEKIGLGTRQYELITM